MTDPVDPIREAFEQSSVSLANVIQQTDGLGNRSHVVTLAGALDVFTQGWHAGRADLLAEQEAAEPVAWLERKTGMATADPTTKDRYHGDYQPLYAHPPAQPAITDEQVMTLAYAHRITSLGYRGVLAFARALLERKP